VVVKKIKEEMLSQTPNTSTSKTPKKKSGPVKTEPRTRPSDNLLPEAKRKREVIDLMEDSDDSVDIMFPF